jgi:glycosyltransferase involved in cell wall biosynthesis
LTRTLVHLRPTNFFGGPEKQIVEQSVRLAGRGWRPVIASFREGPGEVELIEHARARGLETALVESSGALDPRTVGRVRELLRSQNAAVLVTHGYKADITGHLAVRQTGLPVIAWVRGFTGENWKVRLYESLDRWFLRRVPVVVAVSHGTAEMLRQIGVPRERLHVVPNAVLPAPAAVRPAALRDELGIPERAALLVAAGRLSPEKGQAVLVESLPVLVARGLDVHAVLLGDGPDREALAALARRMGVETRVHLPGFRRDVLSCLAAADVVVNPSLTEGLPNVVLEAMSVGAPVVATAVGGVPELIRDGSTGWLVAAGEPGALAAAIAGVLADRGLARNVGLEARATVEAGFTFAVQVEQVLEVLGRSGETA